MESHYIGHQPPPKRRKVWIVRVTTAETQQFVLVNRSIYGQRIHWYGNRSHECTIDSKKCNGCERGWPSKFLGYLYAMTLEHPEPVFLELTNTACEKLTAQLPDRRNLRGVQVRIKKTKGGAKGRYIVEVLERVIPEHELPKELDPKETLTFLWNCKNQHSPERLNIV